MTRKPNQIRSHRRKGFAFAVKSTDWPLLSKVCLIYYNNLKDNWFVMLLWGHTCPNSTCNCPRCNDYLERCRRVNEKNKQKRLEKKAKTGNSSATNQLVASLKKRTKKILINKETVPTVNGIERRKAGRKKNQNISGSGGDVQTVIRRNETIGVDDDGSNPPRLIPQQRVETQATVPVIESSSATDIDANHSNRSEAPQPVPETASPALCAQYLDGCKDLTRKLNAYNLSDDEMMMCFKYSMLRQCLGDVERAAQNILFGKTL